MYNFNKKFIAKHTLAECLEEYDCSYERLRLWCLLHNVKYIKNKKQKQKLYDDEMTKYAGKMTDEVAAQILGCSRLTVLNYRIEHNIQPFRLHRKTIPGGIESILAEYNELGTLQKVADVHGVTRERVRQWFDKAGYQYVKGTGYVKK